MKRRLPWWLHLVWPVVALPPAMALGALYIDFVFKIAGLTP